jgi:hypothetical protein
MGQHRRRHRRGHHHRHRGRAPRANAATGAQCGNARLASASVNDLLSSSRCSQASHLPSIAPGLPPRSCPSGRVASRPLPPRCRSPAGELLSPPRPPTHLPSPMPSSLAGCLHLGGLTLVLPGHHRHCRLHQFLDIHAAPTRLLVAPMGHLAGLSLHHSPLAR